MSFNIEPIYNLLQTEIAPSELGEVLSDIESNYSQVALSTDIVSGEDVAMHLYYLNLLRKAVQSIHKPLN